MNNVAPRVLITGSSSGIGRGIALNIACHIAYNIACNMHLCEVSGNVSLVSAYD